MRRELYSAVIGDVDPGDIVFGDLEGVVIIPREIEVEVVRIAVAPGGLKMYGCVILS